MPRRAPIAHICCRRALCASFPGARHTIRRHAIRVRTVVMARRASVTCAHTFSARMAVGCSAFEAFFNGVVGIVDGVMADRTGIASGRFLRACDTPRDAAWHAFRNFTICVYDRVGPERTRITLIWGNSARCATVHLTFLASGDIVVCFFLIMTIRAPATNATLATQAAVHWATDACFDGCARRIVVISWHACGARRNCRRTSCAIDDVAFLALRV